MTSDAAIEGRLESGPTHRSASTNQRRSRATKPQRTTSAHKGQAARRTIFPMASCPQFRVYCY